jgi:chromosome segregation ATPase
MNRMTWDLRYPTPTPPQQQPQESEFDEGPAGPLVMPGEYKVTLAKRVDGKVTQLAGPVTFKVLVEGQASMKLEDRKVLSDFQQNVARLQRAVTGASRLVGDLKTRLGQIKQALHQTPAAEEKLREDASSLESQLDEITRALRGDNARRSRNENAPTAIGERVANIVDDQRMSTSRPTQTHLDQNKIAGELFTAELGKLKILVEIELPKLEKAMEAAGAPWTPGRVPEWKEE